MKARPILFSGPMVRALLDGSKTQTRRVVKPQPVSEGILSFGEAWKWIKSPKTWFSGVTRQQLVSRPGLLQHCPYGKPGDLLWVRESITTRDKAEDGLRFDVPQYRADFTDSYGLCFTTDDGPRYVEDLRWTPSIHMPRWASRLTLRITDVRVERLQDISEADVIAEGASGHPDGMSHAYRSLWTLINGPGSWEANPWVWAVSFDVIRENVDAIRENAAKEAK